MERLNWEPRRKPWDDHTPKSSAMSTASSGNPGGSGGSGDMGDLLCHRWYHTLPTAGEFRSLRDRGAMEDAYRRLRLLAARLLKCRNSSGVPAHAESYSPSSFVGYRVSRCVDGATVTEQIVQKRGEQFVAARKDGSQTTLSEHEVHTGLLSRLAVLEHENKLLVEHAREYSGVHGGDSGGCGGRSGDGDNGPDGGGEGSSSSGSASTRYNYLRDPYAAEHLVLVRAGRTGRRPRKWPRDTEFSCMYLHGDETPESQRMTLGTSRSSRNIELKTVLDEDDPCFMQLGVYSVKNIERNAYILSYVGKVRRVPPKEMDVAVQLSDVYLDTSRQYAVEPQNWANEARFINDFRGYPVRSRRANVELRPAWSLHTGDMFLGVFALREIREGEQLLLDYGASYWIKQRNVIMSQRYTQPDIPIDSAAESKGIVAPPIDVKGEQDHVNLHHEARPSRLLTPEQHDALHRLVKELGVDNGVAERLLRDSGWKYEKAKSSILVQRSRLAAYRNVKSVEDDDDEIRTAMALSLSQQGAKSSHQGSQARSANGGAPTVEEQRMAKRRRVDVPELSPSREVGTYVEGKVSARVKSSDEGVGACAASSSNQVGPNDDTVVLE